MVDTTHRTSSIIVTDTTILGITFYGNYREALAKYEPQRKNPLLKIGPTPEKVYRSKPISKFKSFRRSSPKVIYRANDNR